MKQKREQGQGAMHGIPQRHGQDPCHDTYRGKVNKKKPHHGLVLGILGVLDRDRKMVAVSLAFLTFLLLVMGI